MLQQTWKILLAATKIRCSQINKQKATEQQQQNNYRERTVKGWRENLTLA